MIDWQEPLEAVHTDGRTARAVFVEAADTPGYIISFNNREYFVAVDGGVYHEKGWSIRNVEPTLRTSDEALRRMEALVERMATRATDRGGCLDITNMLTEADAIQALRMPIDPRLEPVVRSLVANGISEPVARLYARDVLKALDADGAK